MIVELYEELDQAKKVIKKFIRLYVEGKDIIEHHNLKDVCRFINDSEKVVYEGDIGRMSIFIGEMKVEYEL